jgi:hypothetical protein
MKQHSGLFVVVGHLGMNGRGHDGGGYHHPDKSKSDQQVVHEEIPRPVLGSSPAPIANALRPVRFFLKRYRNARAQGMNQSRRPAPQPVYPCMIGAMRDFLKYNEKGGGTRRSVIAPV